MCLELYLHFADCERCLLQYGGRDLTIKPLFSSQKPQQTQFPGVRERGVIKTPHLRGKRYTLIHAASVRNFSVRDILCLCFINKELKLYLNWGNVIRILKYRK